MAEETNLNGAYLHVHDQVVAQVRETLPPEQTLSDLAELYKIFGDATRIRILLVLFQSEVCVYDLAKLLNMTQSAISHQLRLLKQARLVKSRREGRIFLHLGAGDTILEAQSIGHHMVYVQGDGLFHHVSHCSFILSIP